MVVTIAAAAVFQAGGLLIAGAVVAWVVWSFIDPATEFAVKEGLVPHQLARVRVEEVVAPKAVRAKPPIDEKLEVVYAEPVEEEEDGLGDGDLAELISAGYMRPGAPIALGLDTREKWFEMPNLTSLGFGGGQGSGKTVDMTNVVAQLIAKYDGKVQFLIVDPHMNAVTEESEALAQRLQPLVQSSLMLRSGNLPNPVAGGEALASWLKVLRSLKDERLGGTSSDTNKIVLVFDEFASLMFDLDTGEETPYAKPITALLESINTEARKVGMFALVASPTWKATRAKTEFRGSIVSFMVHQMETSIAQQLVPADVAQMAKRLEVGQAIAYSKGKSEVVQVPYLRDMDIRQVIAKYAASAPTSSSVSVPQLIAPAEPTYQEGLSILRYYEALVALSMPHDEIVTALAIRVYGASDESGERKVQAVLDAKERA